jgi:hypothetical protein
MASYAVVARLGADAIRVGGPSGWVAGDRASAVGCAPFDDAPVEDVRVVRSWSSGQVRERAAAIRRAWAHTTFYLFDACGWR